MSKIKKLLSENLVYVILGLILIISIQSYFTFQLYQRDYKQLQVLESNRIIADLITIAQFLDYNIQQGKLIMPQGNP